MLSDIPYEIVSEIASHLPYKDIISLRQALTRQDLRDATNAHVVWLNLAKQYLAKNPHSHLSNIQSLFSFTTNQLRELFEKRLIVDDVWQQPGPIYPSIKRIRGLSSWMLIVKIAPGGRWLFIGSEQCTLYYLDLDADNPEPLLLVPCHDMGDTPGTNCAAAEIEIISKRGDPLSGFILSFVGWDSDGYYEKAGEWLYIWDVIPLENGTLKARRLKNLPLPYSGSPSDLSMNDHLVARTMEQRVDVYWWRQCTETHLVRCTLEFKKKCHITDIYVVGNDKLLVYSRSNFYYQVRLYALESECSEVSKSQVAASKATRIWSCPFTCNYGGSNTSPLYFDGTNYHQTISAIGAISSLTFPALRPEEPIFTRISDFTLQQQEADSKLYGLGLNKGYCRVGAQLYRLGYSCGSATGAYESGVAVDSRLHRFLQGLDIFPAFDEETGRLVSRTMNYIVVQDFSLPLYNIADVCPDLADDVKK